MQWQVFSPLRQPCGLPPLPKGEARRLFKVLSLFLGSPFGRAVEQSETERAKLVTAKIFICAS